MGDKLGLGRLASCAELVSNGLKFRGRAFTSSCSSFGTIGSRSLSAIGGVAEMVGTSSVDDDDAKDLAEGAFDADVLSKCLVFACKFLCGRRMDEEARSKVAPAMLASLDSLAAFAPRVRRRLY